MWIFTRYGFFSVVCARDGTAILEDTLMIRARRRQHLDSLKQQFGLEDAVQTSTDTDYKYRLIVSKAKWIRIMSDLINEIDYCNFKDRVAEVMNDDYNHALSRVWSVMHSIQR